MLVLFKCHSLSIWRKIQSMKTKSLVLLCWNSANCKFCQVCKCHRCHRLKIMHYWGELCFWVIFYIVSLHYHQSCFSIKYAKKNISYKSYSIDIIKLQVCLISCLDWNNRQITKIVTSKLHKKCYLHWNSD